MLSLLQQSLSLPQFNMSSGENSKTEMEWRSLANSYIRLLASPKQSLQTPALSMNAEKKFSKEPTSGGWVWYKNQVLPTFKIRLNSLTYAPIASPTALIQLQQNNQKSQSQQLEQFVRIQCFAVFASNQVIEVQLQGNCTAKFNRDNLSDIRSIRLTETINSLNVSQICQLHPFVPNEFSRVLQMLHGSDPDEIISPDLRGLFYYFSNKKIRHKIFHPFYLAARFHEGMKLYYRSKDEEPATATATITSNSESEPSKDLSEVFLEVQKELELALLATHPSSTRQQQQTITQNNTNNPNQQITLMPVAAKLLIRINDQSDNYNNKSIENDDEHKPIVPKSTSAQSVLRQKVLNYLSPLQSSAIRIIGENDLIPTTYKPIVYEESEYTEAYTRVFPSILNTLFEYQENRVKYPNYLNSVGYSAQKEETIEYQKDVALRDRTTIKYKTTLEHKYDEKLKTKLARVPVYNTANQPSHSSFMHLQFQQQQQQQHHGIDAQIHSMKIETPESIAAKNSMMAVMRNLYANNQETNRGSLMSNSSDTVIATHPLGTTAAIVSQQQHQNDLLREQHLNMFADADDTHSQGGEEEPRTRKARKLDAESSNKNAAAFNNKISLTTPSSKNITTTSFPLLHSFDDLNKVHMNTVQQFSPNHMSTIGASATAPSTADITSFQNHMMMPNCNMVALIQQQQLQNNNNNNNNKHFQNDVLAAYIQANSAMNVNLQQFQQQQQQQQQQQAFAAMILAEQQRNLFQNSNATNVLAAAQNPFMFNQHAAFQQQQQQQQLLEQLAQHQVLYPMIRQ